MSRGSDNEVPAPFKAIQWAPNTPYYKTLANDTDFQLCVKDIISRTGAPVEEIKDIFNTKNFEEFAKCFIPMSVDNVDNYELYEIIGDQTLNKATFSYIFRVVYPKIANVDKKISIGYIDALKAHYISKKFYSTLALDIGFAEFVHRVCFRNQKFTNSLVGSKSLKSIYEDVMEAFIGCLELTLDRYVGIHRSYAYVANFVYDMLSDIYIDFNPSTYWDGHRLLKETNDKIESQVKNRGAALYYHVVLENRQKRLYYAVASSSKDGRENTRPLGISSSYEDDNKEVENQVSKQVIQYLLTQREYASVIAKGPTIESLGIQDLIK